MTKVMLLPSLVLIGLIIIVPSIATIYYAFTSWNGFTQPTFIGFQNYREIFSDKVYWGVVWNNIKWTIFFVTIPIILGLIAASELNNVSSRAKGIFKTIFLLPYVLPSLATARLWQIIFFHPLHGIITGIFDHDFLGTPTTALWAIAIIDNWGWWGFLANVFSAAVDQIDKAYYEIARLEGANRWQVFKNVTLPMILPTVLFMEIMTIIWSFLVFEYIFIITQGGPGRASEVLATLTYKTAFFSIEFGKGCAIATTMILFASIPIATYLWLISKKGGEL